MRKNVLFIVPLLCCLFACTKSKLIVDSTEIDLGTIDRLNQVKFMNPLVGFIVGGEQFDHPTMFKTVDGGSTWNEVNLPTANEQKEIYGIDIFPDGQLITVGYGGTMFVSHDTGKTFTYVQHTSWKILKDVGFINAVRSQIVGGTGFNQGHISDFINDGSGSNQIRDTKNFELSDIDFIDSMNGYIAGYGAILKTTDGGVHWEFTTAKNDYFKAMCWKNVNEGVAVGYEGSILKTTDGGTSWNVIRNGNDITKKKFHFINVERNADQTIIAVGEKGTCYVSRDDGDTWVLTNQFSLRDLRGVVFRDLNTCFVVGELGKLFELKL